MGEEAYHRRLWVDPLCGLFCFGVVWGPVIVARWLGWLGEVPFGLLMAISLLGSVVFVRTSQAAAARWRRRRLPIRRSIDTLPRAELASIFNSLCADRDLGTREFAQALGRDLGLPTELTPTGRPEGSGAEVSGAGDVLLQMAGPGEGSSRDNA